MISAKDIPHFTGDLEQLEQHASGLRNHAGALRQAGSAAHTKFQGLGAFYHAPEAERLFASTAPVRDRSDLFASKIETVAGALDDYAGAVRPIIARLDRLRTRVADFAASLKTDSGEIDDEWTQDQEKIDQHDALWAEVNQAQADFTTAEIAANNKITALVDGPQYVQQGYEGTLVPLGAQIYGYTAEALKHADKLPWGTPEALTYDKFDLSHHMDEARVSVKDNVVGTVTGFIDLFSPGADGNAARKGLGMTVLGLESYLFDPLNQKDSPWKEQVAEGRPYTKAFAKGLVGWDDWEDHPAKAGATVAFNGLTIASGPLAAVSRMAKGGTVAKTAGALAKVGEAIDPISATAKTVGATTRAVPKIAEVTAHARAGFGNAPGTGSTSTVLRLSANTELHLTNGEFIILKDGVPDTTPAPVELPANRHTTSPAPPREHQLVGAGVRGPEASPHAGENFPPQASHGSNNGSSAHNRSNSGGQAETLAPRDPVREPAMAGTRAGDGAAGAVGRAGDELPGGAVSRPPSGSAGDLPGRADHHMTGGPADRPGRDPSANHESPSGSLRDGSTPVHVDHGARGNSHDSSAAHQGAEPTTPGHSETEAGHGQPEGNAHGSGDDGQPHNQPGGHDSPAPGPGEKVLDQLDDSRVVRTNGLITRVDGRPVADYLDDVARDRGAAYRAAKEAGTFPRKQTGACVGAVVDLRTGTIIEGINGKADAVIPIDELHPTLAERYNSIGTPPPHNDHPLGHAEVKAANELLWARTKQGLPDGDAALAEMRAAVEFPYLSDKATGAPGRPAPFCANCNHMLHGVPSSHGRFTGYPPSDENWIQ
ncbi:hypothetical protein [Streptomyces sp. NPDC058644]|uniref:hypothetical protein n=1 Tax=unclassified Streptomyces TaxID=2593676 RepID=UPI003653D337